MDAYIKQGPNGRNGYFVMLLAKNKHFKPQRLSFEYADKHAHEFHTATELRKNYLFESFPSYRDVEEDITSNTHMLEVIRAGRRSKLYFDVDSLTPIDIDEVLGMITAHYRAFFHNDACGEEHIFVSCATGFSKKKGCTKYSYHIVFDNGYCFESNVDIKHFYDYMKRHEVNQALFNCIDEMVYTNNRQMKLVYQSKFGEERVQVPLRGAFRNHLCGVYSHDTGIKPYTFERPAIPVAPPIKPKNVCEKEDAEVETAPPPRRDGAVDIETVPGLLEIFKNHDGVSYATYFKVACICKHEKQPFHVFNNWCKAYSRHDEEKERRCWDSINARKDGEKTPTVKTLRCMVEKEHPLLFQSYKQRIIGETTQITVDLEAHNYTALPKYDERYCLCIAQHMVDYDTVVLKSHLGTGKSTVIRDLIRKNAYESILCITPRKMFAVSIHSDLKSVDGRFVLYDDEAVSKKLSEQKFLVCQLESLVKLFDGADAAPQYDLVIMDECESNLAQFESSTMKRFDDTTAGFKHVIQHAKKTVWCDAFVLDRSIVVLNALRPERKLFIENTRNPYDRTAFCVGNKGKDMVDFIQRFKAHRGDERNIVVSGSKNNSECIYEVLRDDNALLINSDTSDLVKKRIEDVNTFWDAYKHVIYTTTITVGVSYDSEHAFDNQFMHFSCNSASVRDMFQAGVRARTLKNNRMYFSSYSKYLAKDSRPFSFHRATLHAIISHWDKDNAPEAWVKQLWVFNKQEMNANAYFHKEMIDAYLNICGYTVVTQCDVGDAEVQTVEVDSVTYDEIDTITDEEFKQIDALIKSGKAETVEKQRFVKFYFDHFVVQSRCVCDDETRGRMFDVYVANRSNVHDVLSNIRYEQMFDKYTEAYQRMSVFQDNQEQKYERIMDIKRILDVKKSYLPVTDIKKKCLEELRGYLLANLDHIKKEYNLDLRKNNLDDDKCTMGVVNQMLRQWNFSTLKNKQSNRVKYVELEIRQTFKEIHQFCVPSVRGPMFRDVDE